MSKQEEEDGKEDPPSGLHAHGGGVDAHGAHAVARARPRNDTVDP